MAGLSAIFGTAVAAQRYGTQVDILTDLPKVAIVIAVGCAGLAYIFWTLLQVRDRPSLWRGAVAGALTGACVIPLPFFTSTFKDIWVETWRTGEASFLSAAVQAFPPAFETGYLTFVYLTKASVVAIIASAILGLWVSRSRA